MRVLLVEDDQVMVGMVQQALTNQHYVVDTASDGQAGLAYAQSASYDLIVMDVGLPKLNGIALCQQLRSEGCTTPILLMTAKDANSDRIRGLDAGADDYLIKPLNLGELQARVRALLRRGEASRSPVLQVGNLQLDPQSCKVTFNDKPLCLTPKEYSLLELFLRNPARVFSRGQIVEHLWSFDDPPLEDSVKAHIKGLRQKMKAVGAVDWIENVYGIGYRLREGVEEWRSGGDGEVGGGGEVGGDRGDREVGEDAETRRRGDVETLQSAIANLQSPIHSPLPTPHSPSIEHQFNQKRDDLWNQYQGLMAQRMEVLQRAAIALQSKQLSDELRQEAAQAAHKLAGVLGMFDRDQGTDLARELETMLSGNATLLSAQKSELPELVQQLEDLLNLQPLTLPAAPLSLARQEGGNEGRDRRQTARSTSRNLGVNVLVVDDDPLFLSALHPMLEPWGIQLTSLDDPSRFWEVLPAVAPDLLILDVEMPQVSGIELCQALREASQWQGLPVLFLTAHRDRDTIQQVFSVGADDYITKPVVGPELLTRITNRLERMRLLQTLSMKDPLTGLMNQPQSSRELEVMLRQAESGNFPFCLVVLTLMDIRQINLRYGHAVGNEVLRRWGRLLRSAVRDTDGVGYWGNGEFVIGLPGLPKAAISDRFCHLLTTLRQQIFTAPTGDRFQSPFSLTIVEYPTDGSTLQALYQVASKLSVQGVGSGE